MTNDQMAAEYYRAAVEKRRPKFVPETVMVLRAVRSDLPFMRPNAVVKPGAQPVQCNQWGAVSAIASDAAPLGLRPDEFDVLTWRAA